MCVYCGRSLPAALVEAAEGSARSITSPTGEAAGPGRERSMVVFDLSEASPEQVASALGLTRYEAGQRVRRSGYQPHLVAPNDEAAAEGSRLASLGLAVTLVPETEILAASQPFRVLAASFAAGRLEVESEEGGRRLDPPDLLLVVRGAIRRQYMTGFDSPKRVRSATLAPGARFQLHLRHTGDLRPFEIDADTLELRGERRFGASSLLELGRWLRLLTPASLDTGFDRLTPALAPAEEPRGGAAALSAGRGLERRPTGLPVLDNVGQFRFYSGWRAGVERRTGRA